MDAQRKYKIKEPEIYCQLAEADEVEAQNKLDAVFDYIFARALEESRLDNLQSLSYSDNNKGGKSERGKDEIPECNPSF